ncbi:MAG: RnfABCDGE type electron transport complex subunit B [Gammaproteobacteria bacterium]
MKTPTALVDSIDAILPQTQCRRCGYTDCRAYAEAIASGNADINCCPPGGEETIEALAALTGRAAKPLAADLTAFQPGTVAFIDELLCIGCTKCIQACPVDAIVGAPKQMHTVIEALCTGCGLCVAPCPVDCIYIQPPRGSTEGIDVPAAGRARADFFRARYASHNERLTHERAARDAGLEREAAHAPTAEETVGRHREEIAAAMTRVRARRAKRQVNHQNP